MRMLDFELAGESGETHSFILIAEGFGLKTTELVELLVGETVARLGFELCDVEYIKEYGKWVLTLYIDKPEGITIDDCELVSRAVEPILDEKDPIEQQYYLSVSSLGLDRPIKKDADYQRNLGKDVSVKLYAPKNGKKEFSGTLTAFDADSMTIATGKGEIIFVRKDIANCKPVITF